MSSPIFTPAMLAERIIAARRVTGMTQAELQRVSGLPQSQISRLERAQVAQPTFHDVSALASALALDLAVLTHPDLSVFISALKVADSPAVAVGTGELLRLRRERLMNLCDDAQLVGDLREWLAADLCVLVAGDQAEALAESALGLTELDGAVVSGLDVDGVVAAPAALQRASVTGAPLVLRTSVGIAQTALGASVRRAVVALDGQPAQVPGMLAGAARQHAERGVVMLGVDGDGVSCAAQVLCDISGQVIKLPLWQRSAGALRRMGARVELVAGGALRRQPIISPVIVEDPVAAPQGVVAFGEQDGPDGQQVVLGMPVEGLRTHAYISGATGTGKSALLEHLAAGLARQGQGVVLLDPHRSLADGVAAQLLRDGFPESKLLLVDLDDHDWPVAFNPLAIRSQAQVEPTVDFVKSMLVRMLNLNPEAAPRAVQYVEQCVWALCEANLHAFSEGGAAALTLLQVPTFFTDKQFRQLVMQFCTNLSIRESFDPEGPFEKLGERQQLDHVMPILRTFASLSTKDSFGNVFGQSQSKVDPAEWGKHGQVVLCKLPSGSSAAVTSTFMGTLLLETMIGSMVDRRPQDGSTFVVVDELQQLAGPSFAHLLSHGRRHGMHAIVANQVPQDLPAQTLRSLQSNAQTKFSGRLHVEAAREIAEFIASGQEHPRPHDITALDNHAGWANVMLADGRSSGPFTYRGLEPAVIADDDHARIGHLLDRSRQLLARPRAEVIADRRTQFKRCRELLEEHVRRMSERGRALSFDDGDAAGEDFWAW